LTKGLNDLIDQGQSFLVLNDINELFQLRHAGQEPNTLATVVGRMFEVSQSHVDFGQEVSYLEIVFVGPGTDVEQDFARDEGQNAD
jgi:hypothetical protein